MSSERAASATASWSPRSRPTAAASVSFTIRTSRPRSDNASPGVAGAALQTTSAPSPRARPSASTATGRGTSSETRTASVPGRDGDVDGAQGVVRAGGHDDEVLAGMVDADGGDARRGVDVPDPGQVDARLDEAPRRDRRELVGPDGHGHRRAGAEPGRRHRLVGALAPGRPGDVVGGHRRPGAGQLVDDDDEVGVGAAHHMDGRPARRFHARRRYRRPTGAFRETFGPDQAHPCRETPTDARPARFAKHSAGIGAHPCRGTDDDRTR